MSYFPTDVPYMNEEELKANGIKVNCSEKPNSSGLQKCPFCGCGATLCEDEGAYKVFCLGVHCDAQYGWCASEEQAVNGWNRRDGYKEAAEKWNRRAENEHTD